MKTWLALAFLAVLTVAAYSRSLYVPFVFDDAHTIANDPHVNGRAPISIRSPRSVLTTTYRLNYWLDPAPFGFHVVSLLLHLLNGLLVFRIARNLVRDWAVVAVGLFWLHPLMSEGVIYVSARSELLSAFFGLSALCVFMAGWKRCSIPLIFLALFSKESAVIYVALIAWYWMWHERRPVAIVALCVPALAITLFVQQPVFEYSSAGPVDHALQQATGLAKYLTMVTFPLWQSVDHDTASYPAALGVVSIVALLMQLVAWTLLGRRHPVLTFAAVWVAIAVAPRFIVNTAEFMAERHMYLPMVGISILAAAVCEISTKWSLNHARNISESDVEQDQPRCAEVG